MMKEIRKHLEGILHLNGTLYHAIAFFCVFNFWDNFSKEMMDCMRQDLDLSANRIRDQTKSLYKYVLPEILYIDSEEKLALSSNIGVFGILMEILTQLVRSDEFVEACQNFDIDIRFYKHFVEDFPKAKKKTTSKLDEKKA